MVMWVCEASEVKIWTVFAVRPNGPNNKKSNFASSKSVPLAPTKVASCGLVSSSTVLVIFPRWRFGGCDYNFYFKRTWIPQMSTVMTATV